MRLDNIVQWLQCLRHFPVLMSEDAGKPDWKGYWLPLLVTIRHVECKKPAEISGLFKCGGEIGIWTLDTLLTYAGFQDRCFQPLSHLSTNCHRQISTLMMLLHVLRVTIFKAWRCPTLTWGSPTLPSALIRFTSEFGMESGGSKSLWSPSKFFNLESCYCVLYTFNSVLALSPSKPFGCCMVKPHGQLVQVSSTPHNAYTPCLSTF